MIGDYLRAHRELIQPGRAGLPVSRNLQAGQNRLGAVFLDPAEMALYPEWDPATARLVAGSREGMRPRPSAAHRRRAAGG